jgi:hypothetical protein
MCRPCALRLCYAYLIERAAFFSSAAFFRAFSSRAFSRAACRAAFLSIRAAFVFSTAAAAYWARAFFAADVLGRALARAERVRLPRSLSRAITKQLFTL